MKTLYPVVKDAIKALEKYEEHREQGRADLMKKWEQRYEDLTELMSKKAWDQLTKELLKR